MHAMPGSKTPTLNQVSVTSTLPERICDAGRLMFDRRLTDLAGGNISAREGDTVYMSPRFAGQRYHWNLIPENLVVGKWTDDEITLNPAFSREGWSHLFIYRNFPKVRAVIHAHPMNVMPFTASCRTIEPLLEGTQKFGLIGYCEAAPGHTKELGKKVVKAMQGKEELMRIQALPVLIPYHGIILAGEDFDKTLDALERVDQNAYCMITRRLLD
jgi:L-fuculose-phosphate aldolase